MIVRSRRRVEADRAELLLGEVAALVAEPHALLHLADRVRERVRLGLRHLEEVEGEPLRGAAADARQPGELRDEIVDGRAQHAFRLLGRSAEKVADRLAGVNGDLVLVDLAEHAAGAHQRG